MAGKRAAVRADLTQRLLAAATTRIERDGVGALRARDVTKDAGCGLGTIYKCYEDLDDLIIHVNSTTLAKLREALEQGTLGTSNAADQLKSLARTYLQFARNNTHLWLALFEHRLPEGRTAPQWHVEENTSLIGLIAQPVSELEPSSEPEALAARARTYFSAVHGVVLLSLQGKFIALPEGTLERELDSLVERLATAA